MKGATPNTSYLVKQANLQAIQTQRVVVDELKRQLTEAQKRLDAAETLVLYAIDSGHAIEAGALVPVVETTSRVTPKWKEAYATLAGPIAVERVIRETEASITRKLKLIEQTTTTKAA